MPSKFQQRHYEFIATELNELYHEYMHRGGEMDNGSITLMVTVQALGKAFKRDNPNCKEEMFRNACLSFPKRYIGRGL
jgi:hypothetical protein